MKKKAFLALINGAILFALVLFAVYLSLKLMDERFDFYVSRVSINAPMQEITQ